MGIETTSEVWESTKLFVGRSAAFMQPRRRRGSSEKARSRWQFRCIAAPRNHFVIYKAGIQDSGLFLVQNHLPKALLNNKFAPVTFTWGFVESPTFHPRT
jgi:hypothetical protein